MFGAILGALKGIGSGLASGVKSMGSAFQGEDGKFDWDKLMGSTSAFGEGMGPESELGQRMQSFGQAGQAGIAQRAQKRAGGAYKQAQKAGAAAPVQTQTAEAAGIGDVLDRPAGAPIPPPPMPDPLQAPAIPSAAPLGAYTTPDVGRPPQPELPDGLEIDETGHYRRIGGQPLMY